MIDLKERATISTPTGLLVVCCEYRLQI